MSYDFLNLINLKYFCDAVKLGSLSASARANFVTQSAISQGIVKLEKSLGLALVAHHPNRFRLTPEGEVTYKHALSILNRVAEFKGDISQEVKANIGDLEFVSTYSFVLAVLPPHLNRFRSDHPCSKINFGLGKNDEIKKMVKTGAVDFGILPDEGDLDEFQKRDIYEGKFRLYVSQNIQPTEHSKLGFIFAPSKRKETNLMKKSLKESYFKKYKRTPEVIMEIGSWDVIVNLVAEGMGIGYFPDFFGRTRAGCLQEFDLDIHPHHYCMSAISPRGMKLRKSSEIFLSYFDHLGAPAFL